MDFCAAVACDVGDGGCFLVYRIVFAHAPTHRFLALSAEQYYVGGLGGVQRRASTGGVADRIGCDEHSRRQENRLNGGEIVGYSWRCRASRVIVSTVY